MKTKFTLVMAFIVLFITQTNAQELLIDLDTIGYQSSSPDQFINVNGSMYIHTLANGFNNQIWKSDGTAAGTVLLKDNIISSNQTKPVLMLSMNDTLYFVVNPAVPQGISEATLWKSDGTTAGTVLIDSLVTGNPMSQTGDAQPRNFTVVGNKLFFQMGKGNGFELWVTDGSVGGVHQVIDLNPGNNGGGFQYGGLAAKPMVAFNGKICFQGSITGDGGTELYISDGTAAGTGLLKDINTDNSPGSLGSRPESWVIYNNELYFSANNGTDDGIWKTDSTTAGTVLVSTGAFVNPTIFKSAIYFGRDNDLWKTDGTPTGTVFVTDSTPSIRGANADYLIAYYVTPLGVAPYVEFHFKRTDGTTTTAVSTAIGNGASFVVLNNKMYNFGAGDGLWASDGTEAGSGQLATNVSNYFHVYNGNLYYNAWTRIALTGGNGYGYELWWLEGGATTAITEINQEHSITVYPNPANSSLYFAVDGLYSNSAMKVQLFDVTGKLVREENALTNQINVAELMSGFYVLSLTANGKTQQQKFIIQH